MIKISLDEYKKSSKYLYLFDVVIKERTFYNKDAFLSSLEIAPTSYRRARSTEQNIGFEIVGKLAEYFNLKNIDDNFIEEIEKMVNEVFFDVNYKVYKKYDKHLMMIEELLKENYVVYPILKLLKLFLNLFSNGSIPKLKEENKEEYIEIQRYYHFFSEPLKEIYDLIMLVYSDTFSKETLAKQYSNGIYYSIIAINYRREKEHYKSLYFAQKAKDIFIQENNYKRTLIMNFTILNNLASTSNYNDYYKLAHGQYLSISSLELEESERINALKHLVCSCVATKKYQDVFLYLVDRKSLTLTEIMCLIIAGYYTMNKAAFNTWFSEILIKNENYKYTLDNLIDYLEKPEKGKLHNFTEKEIMASLIDILSDFN